MPSICNPIIPGYYPDPSICRVGDEFYLVCSSFELCPALPVFRSRDLANWEKLCNAFSAEQGLQVFAWAGMGGVMAPTIRYHDGTYYIINANMNRGACCNYILTAKDPAGPWSEPVYLPDVPNIDASMFFDEDGSCYLIGTGMAAVSPEGEEGRCIWACPFDTDSMTLIGTPTAIWNSALRGAAAPEAPHIYKRNGWYYLMIAEGGTEHDHSITVARSREVLGWYEGNPANPILTHRHLGRLYPVCNVGHGDLTETPDGRWYCVMLASRLIDGYHKNLGRETFLCPVEWEEDWPVLCPGEGRLAERYPLPEGCWHPVPAPSVRDDFDCGTLSPDWVFWGTPSCPFHRVENSRLYLRCLPRPLELPILPLRSDRTPEECFRESVSGLFRRQTDLDLEVAAQMTFIPSGGEQAGLVLVQAMNHTLRVERAVVDGEQILRAVISETAFHRLPFLPGYDGKTSSETLAIVRWDKPDVILSLRIHRQRCDVLYGDGEERLGLLCTVDLTRINPPDIGGLTGTLIGLYASGNGDDSQNEAAFDWMDYRPLPGGSPERSCGRQV